MAEELAVVALSDADLAPGDDGAGEGGAEKVALLEGSIAHNGLEDHILDQLALEVLTDKGLGAQLRNKFTLSFCRYYHSEWSSHERRGRG